MDQLLLSILYATLAGAMIPCGAFVALRERIRPKWLEQELRHSIIAFGGGILLAAVSLVLVPQGISYLSVGWSIAAIGAGGLVFFWLDRLVEQHGGSAAQLVAMVSDFIPEAMALGALFASNDPAAPLLAVLIGLQNLPEGFNAYRELLVGRRHSSNAILIWFMALVPFGPLAALLGHLYLVDRPRLVGFVMLFAAGGILYLIFQDIAPQAHLQRRWAPSLGAVGGFMLGLLGHMLVH
jgi:ZIP family zinc transporter